MRSFIFKLRRSISWFIFIWKMGDYEDEYMHIIEIMEYQIKRMLKYCSKPDSVMLKYGEDGPDNIKEMKEFLVLIDKAKKEPFDLDNAIWVNMCNYFRDNAQKWWI